MDGAKFRQQWLDSVRESVNPGDRSSRDRVTSNAPSSFAGFTEGRLWASTNGWIFSEDDMRAVGVRVTGVGDNADAETNYKQKITPPRKTTTCATLRRENSSEL